MRILILGNAPTTFSNPVFFHLTNSSSFSSTAASSLRFGDRSIVNFEVVVGTALEMGMCAGSVWGLEAIQADGIIYALEYPNTL